MAERKKNNCILSSEEQARLRSRHTHNDVLNQAQFAKANLGDKRHKIKQGMYLHSIGKIPNYSSKTCHKSFNSEIVENYLESVVLYENVEELIDNRKEFAVIEDDLGPELEQIISGGTRPSYENLVRACGRYDSSAAVQMHIEKSKTTSKYFTGLGVEKNEARAFACAIAFYTGAYSYAISTEATILARRHTTDQLTTNGELDRNALLIMYYLIKGLSHIPFYWGTVVRFVNLNSKELEDYRAGEIITWLHFSSADKGGQDMSHFTGRNTKFTIESLTGRSIQYFSNCADNEDEVLFLPHSSFLVCHVDYDPKMKQNKIFLRQIEIGICKHVILWVDDKIFDRNWENKRHMEHASRLGTRINVHFIPKSNTESALAYLRSEFGQRLKTSDTFRIVTDMKRINESDPSTAGARLIHEIRALDFHQKCLIFTGHALSAEEKMARLFRNQTVENVKITHNQTELENFVTFKCL